MADIRINSLPTTASASSSNDFLAIDGATNGTRKLNAFSPTFGGSVTVSGTGTYGAIQLPSGTTSIYGVAFGTDTNLWRTDSGNLELGGSSVALIGLNVGGTNKGYFYNNGTDTTLAGAGTFTLKSNSSVTALTIDTSQNSTFAGNLTVSGTIRSNTQEGFKIAAASGYFAGYEADGTTLNGYLQFINSTGTLLNQSIAAKSIQLAIAGTPQLTLTTGAATLAGNLTVSGGTISSGSGTLTLNSSANTVVLQSAGTTALTLDGSQNAQFVGRVRIGSSTIGASANPWFTAVASNGDFGLGFQGSANGAIRTGIKYTVATNLGGLDFMVGGDNNNDASVTALSLSAAGNATFAGAVIAGTWSSGTADKLKVSTAVNDYAAYFANIASSGGSYGIRLHTNTTAATDYLLVATSGAGGGSTRFIIKSDGTLNAPSLPTSSAGLSAGDIWNDGGTLKIV